MAQESINAIVGGIQYEEPSATYKRVVLKSNLSFKSQVEGSSNANSLFIIRWDFDLGGEIVNIPSNCILQFEGGVLRHGAVRLYSTMIWPNYNALTVGNIGVFGYPAIGTIGYVDGTIKYCDGNSWVGEQELFYKEYTKQHNNGDFVYDGSVVKSNYDYYEVPVTDLLSGEIASYKMLKYGFVSCKAYFVKEGSPTVYFKDISMPYDFSTDHSILGQKNAYSLYLINNSSKTIPRDLRIVY